MKSKSRYNFNIKTIDQYIKQYPKDVQVKLQTIRKLVKKLAPKATESISYGIPAFSWNGRLVYFAAYAKHISIYPFPSSEESFKKATTGYKTSKGTIQFPIDKPLPMALVTRIVKYRVNKNKDLLPRTSAPAIRALASIGITKLSQLQKAKEEDLLKLHGFGPKAIRMFKEAGVKFKK